MKTGRLSQRGQGLVEFAVIFPIFAFMLGVVIDGGLLMGRYNTVNHAATVGARFGAVSTGTDTAVASAVALKTAQYAPRPKAPATYVQSCDAPGAVLYTVCVQWLRGPNGEAPGDVGSLIRVKVKYHYDALLSPPPPLSQRWDGWDVYSCVIERQEQAVNVSAPPGSGTGC